MHESVYKFVERSTSRGLRDKRTLEVGSLNINGSVRDLFIGEYVGVDLIDGRGVDVVADAHKLSKAFEPESFDLVLCLEMLEHDTDPWTTCHQIGKVLAPGGTLIVTTRSNGFPEHNNPDCWRFLKDGMKVLLGITGCKTKRLDNDPEVSGWHALCVKE